MDSVSVITITVVGDDAVGKTALQTTFIDNKYPVDYVPTVFDNHLLEICVNNIRYVLYLWDIAGSKNLADYRSIAYPITKCFFLCYSIADRSSFENVAKTWVKDLREYDPDCSIVLIGTKLDLRESAGDGEAGFVSYAEGVELCKQILAEGFVECSALTRTNLAAVFETATKCLAKSEATSTTS